MKNDFSKDDNKGVSENIPVDKQKEIHPSSAYKLLKGEFNFTDEPLWFRMIMYLITAAFFFAIVWALHKWAIPAFIANKLSGLKWAGLAKFIKSRSP